MTRYRLYLPHELDEFLCEVGSAGKKAAARATRGRKRAPAAATRRECLSRAWRARFSGCRNRLRVFSGSSKSLLPRLLMSRASMQSEVRSTSSGSLPARQV